LDAHSAPVMRNCQYLWIGRVQATSDPDVGRSAFRRAKTGV
jgi:hypothetical protein